MKKILLTIVSIFFLFNKSHSQSNDTEALLYNISIGGIFGTIGAIINKKPYEKLDKVILKGFSRPPPPPPALLIKILMVPNALIVVSTRSTKL